MGRPVGRTVTVVALFLGTLLGLAVGLLGVAIVRMGLTAPNNHPLDDVVPLIGMLISFVSLMWLVLLWRVSHRVRRITPPNGLNT